MYMQPISRHPLWTPDAALPQHRRPLRSASAVELPLGAADDDDNMLLLGGDASNNSSSSLALAPQMLSDFNSNNKLTHNSDSRNSQQTSNKGPALRPTTGESQTTTAPPSVTWSPDDRATSCGDENDWDGDGFFRSPSMSPHKTPRRRRHRETATDPEQLGAYLLQLVLCMQANRSFWGERSAVSSSPRDERGTHELTQHRSQDMVMPVDFTAFDCVAVPTATAFKDFVLRLSGDMCCSPECFVLASVYLERLLQKNSHLLVTLRNIQRLYFTALVLAAKMQDDITYRNAYYATVAGDDVIASVQMFNVLERQLLLGLNYNLYVVADGFAASQAIYMAMARSLVRSGWSLDAQNVFPPCLFDVVPTTVQHHRFYTATYKQVSRPCRTNPLPMYSNYSAVLLGSAGVPSFLASSSVVVEDQRVISTVPPNDEQRKLYRDPVKPAASMGRSEIGLSSSMSSLNPPCYYPAASACCPKGAPPPPSSCCLGMLSHYASPSFSQRCYFESNQQPVYEQHLRRGQQQQLLAGRGGGGGAYLLHPAFAVAVVAPPILQVLPPSILPSSIGTVFCIC